MPGAAEVVATHCTAHDYDDPGKPAIAWNDPEARAAVVAAVKRAGYRYVTVDLEGLRSGNLNAALAGPPSAGESRRTA